MGVKTARRAVDVQALRVDALTNVADLRQAGQVTLVASAVVKAHPAQSATVADARRAVSGTQAARALARRVVAIASAVDATADYLAFSTLAAGVDLEQSPPLDLLRRVDQVPGPGPAFTVHDGSVSGVWDELLDRAEVADIQLSALERAQLDEAERLLYADRESGEPSEALTRYHTLLKNWLDAETARTSAVGTAVPAATAAAESAATRLETEGKRVAIESATSTVRSLGRRGPSAAFQRARNDRAASPGLTNAADNSLVPECGFAPDLDEVAWTPVEVSLDELSAPPAPNDPLDSVDLEGPLLSHVHDDPVSAITAEFALIEVDRPWLDPTILTSRAWRFPTDVGLISDGGAPPSGKLPAYISGLVLMRNVRTTRVDPSAQAMVSVAVSKPRLGGRRRPGAARPAPRSGRSTTRRSATRDHRTAAPASTTRDHRTAAAAPRARPTSRSTRRAAPAARAVTSRVEHHHEQPVICAVACVTVPRCPDPDPLLFPPSPSGGTAAEQKEPT